MYSDEVKKCFEEGLLKIRSPSIGLARKSIKQAESFLYDAEKLIESGMTRMSVIALYNAFFHAARALLFKDGIKERSHYCLARYIETEYVSKGKLDKKFVFALDNLRDLRHASQYSLNALVIDENLNDFFDLCIEFISKVEKIVK